MRSFDQGLLSHYVNGPLTENAVCPLWALLYSWLIRSISGAESYCKNLKCFLPCGARVSVEIGADFRSANNAHFAKHSLASPLPEGSQYTLGSG